MPGGPRSVVPAMSETDDAAGADVEFFWDPMCPWAWLTSRWVAEVARQRDLTVDWRFISLKLLNAGRDYGADFPDGYVAGHTSGLKLLRVAAAVREAEGRGRMGELYTTVRRRRPRAPPSQGDHRALGGRVPRLPPLGRPRRLPRRRPTTRPGTSCCRPRPTRR